MNARMKKVSFEELLDFASGIKYELRFHNNTESLKGLQQTHINGSRSGTQRGIVNKEPKS